jgi:hypothetical protein
MFLHHNKIFKMEFSKNRSKIISAASSGSQIFKAQTYHPRARSAKKRVAACLAHRSAWPAGGYGGGLAEPGLSAAWWQQGRLREICGLSCHLAALGTGMRCPAAPGYLPGSRATFRERPPLLSFCAAGLSEPAQSKRNCIQKRICQVQIVNWIL